MIPVNNPSSFSRNLRLTILFLFFLYLFLISIQMMGMAFKYFGKGLAEQLLLTTSAPLTGLFIGLLATAITQSSSMTTSVVVGMVASGAMPLHNAIPLIMGANIGTTVTNLIVSLGHIHRKEEFRRAFAASVVHDIFNILSVIIIFPLQYFTNYLEWISTQFEKVLISSGGLSFSSPLKMITEPVAEAAADLMGDRSVIILIVALTLLFVALRYMVLYMKALIMERAEVVFERTIFRTPLQGMLFGMLLTSLVQSSSVTTSLIVPLAGAGMIRLDQVFPYTMGANVGTTITAIMAALATGSPSALAVALSHLMFNVTGMAVFWWCQWLPIWIAEKLATVTARNRGFAVFYILMIFFIVPITLIYLLR